MAGTSSLCAMLSAVAIHAVVGTSGPSHRNEQILLQQRVEAQERSLAATSRAVESMQSQVAQMQSVDSALRALNEDLHQPDYQRPEFRSLEHARDASGPCIERLQQAEARAAALVTRVASISRQTAPFFATGVDEQVKAEGKTIVDSIDRLARSAQQLAKVVHTRLVSGLATQRLAASVLQEPLPSASQEVREEQQRQYRTHLERRYRWLMEEAHAPLLAAGLRGRLAKLDREEQPLGAPRIVRRPDPRRYEAPGKRVAAVRAYLQAPPAGADPACVALAEQLGEPEYSSAHEQRFVKWLSCVQDAS